MILEAKNIHFSYENQNDNAQEHGILRGIHLQLAAGDSVAIVGASGSGKSTLLHVLAGLDQPNRGEVWLCGHNLSVSKDAEKSALRSRYMGFVYQFHHLLAEFSALENVALPLLIRGMAKQEALQQAAAYLERVGLAHRLQHRPAALSGGERQRAAIARALINRPACLLADEPTGNLDQENAQQAQALMLSLLENQQQESASALLLVTHDLHLAQQMKRRYRLVAGQLEAF